MDDTSSGIIGVVGDCDGDLGSGREEGRMRQIHFEIDEGMGERWEKVTGKLKRGMQSKLLRAAMLLVIQQLETGRQVKVSELIQVELRKEEGIEQ